MNFCIIIVGPSGVGKTFVGRVLAKLIGKAAKFVDADDYHSVANKEKMAQGNPLTDEDRGEWLRRLSDQVIKGQARRHPVVLACSALKKKYRDRLRTDDVRLCFVELVVAKDLLTKRLSKRHGHFMPPSLLDSQLKTFEPLREEADCFTADNSREDGGAWAAVTIYRDCVPASWKSEEGSRRAVRLLAASQGRPALSQFAEKILAATLLIERGEVLSYGAIAKLATGNTNAARAVGQCLRSNPFAPLVPCHRVLASSGHLNGFNGSKDQAALGRKRKLLLDEGYCFDKTKKKIVNKNE